jgi:hypothetical protein
VANFRYSMIAERYGFTSHNSIQAQKHESHVSRRSNCKRRLQPLHSWCANEAKPGAFACASNILKVCLPMDAFPCMVSATSRPA